MRTVEELERISAELAACFPATAVEGLIRKYELSDVEAAWLGERVAARLHEEPGTRERRDAAQTRDKGMTDVQMIHHLERLATRLHEEGKMSEEEYGAVWYPLQLFKAFVYEEAKEPIIPF